MGSLAKSGRAAGFKWKCADSLRARRRIVMSIVVIRAVSIGLLAGLATFLTLGPSVGYGLQIWAVFIAWACFFHLGGGLEGLKKTIIHNLFGVIVGVVAMGFATQLPSGILISYAAWAAIGVAVTICVIVLASQIPMLADVPSSLLGYVAILMATLPDNRLERMLAPALENPILGVVASLVVGASVAFVAEVVADFLHARFARAGAGAAAKA
jgi:hypothetical protein